MAVTLATVNSSYTFLNRLIIVLTYLGSWAVQTLKAVVQQTVGLKGMQTCMLISLSQHHHCNVKCNTGSKPIIESLLFYQRTGGLLREYVLFPSLPHTRSHGYLQGLSALCVEDVLTTGVRSVAADHACSHLGKAEGICTVLRAAAYHRAQRCVFVPMDIIMRVRPHPSSPKYSCTAMFAQTLAFTLLRVCVCVCVCVVCVCVVCVVHVCVCGVCGVCGVCVVRVCVCVCGVCVWWVCVWWVCPH